MRKQRYKKKKSCRDQSLAVKWKKEITSGFTVVQ